MVLRPLLVARLGHSFFGVVLMGVGVVVTDNLPQPASVPLGVLVAIAGVVAAVRGLALKVVLTEGALKITGLFWSRCVPRRAVSAVSDFPAIQWRDKHGRSRWSPLVGFPIGGRNLPFVNRHNQAQMDSLRRWLRKGRR